MHPVPRGPVCSPCGGHDQPATFEGGTVWPLSCPRGAKVFPAAVVCPASRFEGARVFPAVARPASRTGGVTAQDVPLLHPLGASVFPWGQSVPSGGPPDQPHRGCTYAVHPLGASVFPGLSEGPVCSLQWVEPSARQSNGGGSRWPPVPHRAGQGVPRDVRAVVIRVALGAEVFPGWCQHPQQ